MKSYSELRQEAWRIAVSRWSFRGLYALFFFALITAVTLVPLQGYYQENGIQTWAMFAELQLKLKHAGLDVAVASSQQFWSMTWASAFESFVEYLVKGLAFFGLASVALKAARGEEKGWFAAVFGGFRMPLDVLWLMLLMMLRIVLWGLLFVIPGIIAAFRYSMAWYVKVDHPDYSAAECLAESGRMMKGNKGRLFVYGLSYFGWVLLGAAGLVVSRRFGLGGGAAASLFEMALSGYLLFLLMYVVLFGNTVFYLDLKRNFENKTETAATDVVT